MRSGEPDQQVYAKAYPTIRELSSRTSWERKGSSSSICPIDVNDNATGDDPLYGYRPAVSNLVDRMRPTLAFAGK